MDNVIKVDFQNKKSQTSAADPKISKNQRVEKSNVTFVNFKTREVVETVMTEEIVTEEFDMSDFNTPPYDSNFAIFTDYERFMHSEHILSYFHQMDLCEILHFVNMGVLDKRKLAVKLGVPYHEQDQVG